MTSAWRGVNIGVGNPSVILIDEFSTGIDAKMKRDMWATLKNVSTGKAVVITTRELALETLGMITEPSH